MLELIIENKELIKIFYGLVIAIICTIIVIKTDKLFRISNHQGIRYFRNAFFFYGIFFLIRYLIIQPPLSEMFLLNSTSYKFLVEFFVIMAGFFLLYSLIWKQFEYDDPYPSSLLNKNLMIFYAMTVIIFFIDYVWNAYYFLFFSQVILFISASIISYINYAKKGEKRMFLKFYFIAMILSLTAWLLNSISALYLEWNIMAVIAIYIINVIIFLLFLYGVVYVTKRD